MSNVLIKNMEMPEHCYDCVFEEKGWCCAVDGIRRVESIDRPDWCPLVEVSDVYNWTPISAAEPPGGIHVLVTMQWEDDDLETTELDYGVLKATRWPHLDKVIAWAPLPEPYKEETP